MSEFPALVACHSDRGKVLPNISWILWPPQKMPSLIPTENDVFDLHRKCRLWTLQIMPSLTITENAVFDPHRKCRLWPPQKMSSLTYRQRRLLTTEMSSFSHIKCKFWKCSLWLTEYAVFDPHKCVLWPTAKGCFKHWKCRLWPSANVLFDQQKEPFLTLGNASWTQVKYHL